MAQEQLGAALHRMPSVFVDGRLWGWRGFFGGNRRLYAEVLKTLGPDAGDG